MDNADGLFCQFTLIRRVEKLKPRSSNRWLQGLTLNIIIAKDTYHWHRQFAEDVDRLSLRHVPGIDVPYISAIVDLDGGGTVKGNLIGIDPDPANLAFDMPVDVIFDDALGRKDKEGNSYISYFFKPAA